MTSREIFDFVNGFEEEFLFFSKHVDGRMFASTITLVFAVTIADYWFGVFRGGRQRDRVSIRWDIIILNIVDLIISKWFIVQGIFFFVINSEDDVHELLFDRLREIEFIDFALGVTVFLSITQPTTIKTSDSICQRIWE